MSLPVDLRRVESPTRLVLAVVVAGFAGAGLNFLGRGVPSSHREGEDEGKRGEEEAYHSDLLRTLTKSRCGGGLKGWPTARGRSPSSVR
jgi:hypothetical protein